LIFIDPGWVNERLGAKEGDEKVVALFFGGSAGFKGQNRQQQKQIQGFFASLRMTSEKNDNGKNSSNSRSLRDDKPKGQQQEQEQEQQLRNTSLRPLRSRPTAKAARFFRRLCGQ
jgi:hypothetical protein